MNAQRSGFTLIEVVIALAILGISVALAMQVVSASLNQVRNIRNHVGAAHYADAVMNDLVTRDDVSRSGDLLPGMLPDMIPANETYRWHAVINEIFEPVEVMPGARPGWVPQELPVKKVTIDLTVFWRGRFGENSLKLFTVKLAPNERLIGAGGGRPPIIR